MFPLAVIWASRLLAYRAVRGGPERLIFQPVLDDVASRARLVVESELGAKPEQGDAGHSVEEPTREGLQQSAAHGACEG